MTKFKVNAILFLTVLLWSSAFVGIRFAITDYSPGALALLRFMIASLCLYLLNHRVRDKSIIPISDKIKIGFIGVIGIGIYHFFLNYGEVTVSAGVASFVMGLMPLFTIILSAYVLKEKMSKNLWLGMIISLIGLFLIIMGEETEVGFDYGVIAVLVAAIAGSIHNVYQKPFLNKYHAVEVTAWVMWGGTLGLLIFLPSLFQDIQHATLATTAAVIYLGIFPAALAFIAWGYVMHYISVSKAVIAMYGMPILSTFLAFVLLGESPTLLAFIGGIVALAGAFIANSST